MEEIIILLGIRAKVQSSKFNNSIQKVKTRVKNQKEPKTGQTYMWGSVIEKYKRINDDTLPIGLGF